MGLLLFSASGRERFTESERTRNVRGYRIAVLADVFSRYLGPTEGPEDPEGADAGGTEAAA
jgi:hypothetical protein